VQETTATSALAGWAELCKQRDVSGLCCRVVSGADTVTSTGVLPALCWCVGHDDYCHIHLLVTPLLLLIIGELLIDWWTDFRRLNLLLLKISANINHSLRLAHC
jgi:hypothetical protein